MAKHQGQITAIYTGGLVMALQAVGMKMCCFYFIFKEFTFSGKIYFIDLTNEVKS